MLLSLLLAVLCVFSDAAVIHPRHGRMHVKKRQELNLSETGPATVPLAPAPAATSDKTTSTVEATADVSSATTSASSFVESSSTDLSESASPISTETISASTSDESSTTPTSTMADGPETTSISSGSSDTLTSSASSTTETLTSESPGTLTTSRITPSTSAAAPNDPRMVTPWPDYGTIYWCAANSSLHGAIDTVLVRAYALWEGAGLGENKAGKPSIIGRPENCTTLRSKALDNMVAATQYNRTLWVDATLEPNQIPRVRPIGFMERGSHMNIPKTDAYGSYNVALARALGQAWGLRWETQNATLWKNNIFDFNCTALSQYADLKDASAVDQYCVNQPLASDEGFNSAYYLPMMHNRAPGLAQPHSLDLDSIMLFSTFEHGIDLGEDENGVHRAGVLVYMGDIDGPTITPRRTEPSTGDIARIKEIYPGDWIQELEGQS